MNNKSTGKGKEDKIHRHMTSWAATVQSKNSLETGYKKRFNFVPPSNPTILGNKTPAPSDFRAIVPYQNCPTHISLWGYTVTNNTSLFLFTIKVSFSTVFPLYILLFPPIRQCSSFKQCTKRTKVIITSSIYTTKTGNRRLHFQGLRK
jgi:hypothetical protein